MKSNPTQRRQFLRTSGMALAMIPILAISDRALAATNATLRGSLKYQDTPQAEKQCSNCLQFVPGKTPKDKGGCKIMPGDTEISPQGYCAAWTKKP